MIYRTERDFSDRIDNRVALEELCPLQHPLSTYSIPDEHVMKMTYCTD